MKELLKEKKLITILRKVAPDRIVPVVEALREGGVRFVEVTFDQSSATGLADTAAAIRSIAERFNDIYVGAGTVMSVAQVDAAADAGARYIISPNTDVEVIHRTVERGMLSMPGALTPSEIALAYNEGASYVKVFPAGDFGPAYIKSIRAPISHIPLLAVGGVELDNMMAFYKAGICGFGIGSNIVRKDLIAAGNYGELSKLAARYTALTAEMKEG